MPTGIVFITRDNVNIQPTIVTAVNKLGINDVKPFAHLAKPFAAVPKITANKRIMYAIILFTNKRILLFSDFIYKLFCKGANQ